MSFGQIVLGILLFALATAVLYVWGLRKSMTQNISESTGASHKRSCRP